MAGECRISFEVRHPFFWVFSVALSAGASAPQQNLNNVYSLQLQPSDSGFSVASLARETRVLYATVPNPGDYIANVVAENDKLLYQVSFRSVDEPVYLPYSGEAKFIYIYSPARKLMRASDLLVPYKCRDSVCNPGEYCQADCPARKVVPVVSKEKSAPNLLLPLIVGLIAALAALLVYFKLWYRAASPSNYFPRKPPEQQPQLRQPSPVKNFQQPGQLTAEEARRRQL